MGAWGTDPWDNDTAAVYCCRLDEMPLRQWVIGGLNSVHEEEQYVAAWMLERTALVYPGAMYVDVALAVTKIEALLGDWVESWFEWQDDIRTKLEALRDALLKVGGENTARLLS